MYKKKKNNTIQLIFKIIQTKFVQNYLFKNQ